MKKLVTLLLSGAMLFAGLLMTGCDKVPPGLTLVRLNEVARSVFYAPMYAAVTEGYFEEEGLYIELVTGQGADKVMTALSSKSADIGLLGPEATVYAQAEGKLDYPIIFAQLTKRDGSFIVSKKDEKDTFKWTDLRGKHILAGRKGGMPSMTLQYVVNSNGMEITDMNFDQSVDFAMMGPTFVSQPNIDYTTLFEPTASEVEKNGKGYVVAAVGEASGLVPYTSFSASKSYIESNEAVIKSFIRAIIKGYDFTVNADPLDVAKAMQPFFTGIELDMLKSSVIRYGEIDAWCETPYFAEESYLMLQTVMMNAGELSKNVPYTKAVDNTYVNAVIAERKTA
ncbi:MAG: ABC transporter substrate-binding protein [Clostridiales bacterium]|jgi:NitT/TauT family transport system substrate-binding protein|nr:ABC transporter substrate-binding protein [Clostridiales bacterium]